jgi:hypothetical protein
MYGYRDFYFNTLLRGAKDSNPGPLTVNGFKINIS